MSHYHYDCEEYCENCLPVDPESEDVDLDQGEQDSPANCCKCHVPLDYSLTTDGVKHVLDAMRESLRQPREKRNEIHACYEKTYYEGSRHVEIVRDWAKHIEWYSLNNKDEKFVRKFLSWTAK